MAAWKPRCSALGHYMSCTYRAAFDRAIHEGLLDAGPEVFAAIEEKKASSPYADLGTCIHYHLQAGIGAEFPGPQQLYAPTPEQLANAAELFGGNVVKAALAIRECAVFAAKHMPALAPGQKWKAEVPVRTRHYPGHIDFLCAEAGLIVDLKTTSRPPLHPTIKPSHLVQLLAYVDAIEEANGRPAVPILKQGVMLYVDAQSAGWALPIPVDLHDPGIIEYRNMVRAFAASLCSKNLYKIAHPSIGPACEEWCPYTMLCRDRYKSGTGTMMKPTLPIMKGPFHAAAPA